MSMARNQTAAAEQESAIPDDPALQLIAVNTMAGDVRDFLLDRLMHDHSALPWNMRGEDEQKRYIEGADMAARRLIGRIASLIASRGQPAIGAHVKKAALKDVIALELHVGLTHPLRHQLLDSVGAEVVIVLTGFEEFSGDRGAPKINKDQAAMFGDDDAEAATA